MIRRLKPCPFCGSKVKIVRSDLYVSVIIHIDSAPCILSPYVLTPMRKEETTLRAWNKRKLIDKSISE